MRARGHLYARGYLLQFITAKGGLNTYGRKQRVEALKGTTPLLEQLAINILLKVEDLLLRCEWT
jgi:hypothetical protein